MDYPPGTIVRIIVNYWDPEEEIKHKEFTIFQILDDSTGLCEGIFDGNTLTDQQLMYATDYAARIYLKQKSMYNLTVKLAAGREIKKSLAVLTPAMAWQKIAETFVISDKQTAQLIHHRRQTLVQTQLQNQLQSLRDVVNGNSRKVPRRHVDNRYFNSATGGSIIPLGPPRPPTPPAPRHAVVISSSDELDEGVS